MSMSDFAPWLGPAIALAALIYTIVGSRAKAHGQKITAIEQSVASVHNDLTLVKHAIELRVDKVEDRCTKLEAEMAHMPDKEVTHRLELTVANLRGDVQALTESIKPIRAIADRVQEAILDRVTNT